MTVLVVDDSPNLLKLLKLTLQKRGIEVYDASRATEALDIAQKHHLDLLICDVVLGEGVEGQALARTIVEDRPNLPVLFISGYPFDVEEHQQHYVRCGYLRKPFQSPALMRAITDLTGFGAQ